MILVTWLSDFSLLIILINETLSMPAICLQWIHEYKYIQRDTLKMETVREMTSYCYRQCVLIIATNCSIYGKFNALSKGCGCNIICSD